MENILILEFVARMIDDGILDGSFVPRRMMDFLERHDFVITKINHLTTNIETMKFKALKSDEPGMWVVFDSFIPEGYGFSQTPQLLGKDSTMDDLNRIFPDIDLSRFKLVDIAINEVVPNGGIVTTGPRFFVGYTKIVCMYADGTDEKLEIVKQIFKEKLSQGAHQDIKDLDGEMDLNDPSTCLYIKKMVPLELFDTSPFNVVIILK